MRGAWFALALLIGRAQAESTLETIPVQITWAYPDGPAGVEHWTAEAGSGLQISNLSHTGPIGGAHEGVRFTLTAPKREYDRIQDLNIIWADVLAAADPDTANRLGNDAGMVPDSPCLFVHPQGDRSRGFAVTLDQLRRYRAFWVQSYGVLVDSHEPFVSYEEHQRELTKWQGHRVLQQVDREPDASYEQFAERWEDMGSPLYVNPQQRGPGHIICLSWDSGIHKFGIDRGGGVHSDLGNPDQFQSWFDFGDITKGIARSWRGQSLLDGLPVVTTILERDAVRYELEQFAYPLNGPPAGRFGNVPMVLMQRLKVSSMDGRARDVPVTLCHRRALTTRIKSTLQVQRRGKSWSLVNGSLGETLLEVDGGGDEVTWAGVRDYEVAKLRRADLTITVHVPSQGACELIVKLPSPMLDGQSSEVMRSLDYGQTRARAIDFWTAWESRGAKFEVPEKVVNDLFRASLWHALRLPRRHDTNPPQIDLPYSNFAYSQDGTPWPINQAVYVDYMLYGLRGYDSLAAEELGAQYGNNQETNGRVGGFASWMAYTPGMLYAVARNYLLSGDRSAFQQNLPQSLRSLDWCLQQVSLAQNRTGLDKGLIRGPLNDNTGDGNWAFNQAYFYAGLNEFAQALEQIGDRRATEARTAAHQIADAAGNAFRYASARSPLVQLADHTWSPYVPTEAGTFHRLLNEWYPADVDTGPLHMLRLKLLPVQSELADDLLNDHEDNLYLQHLGIANEPVYNQQATAYVLRDEPKAVVRAFYSLMASGFSHSALEPVEHRFTHGQYYGPPSTDGAWFELYRNMLISERDDGSLLLCGFTPRTWLDPGKRIVVERAPTQFGAISMTLFAVSSSELTANIRMPDRGWPATVLVRFRHPSAKPIKAVSVNAEAWTDFKPEKEWVRIRSPREKELSISVTY